MSDTNRLRLCSFMNNMPLLRSIFFNLLAGITVSFLVSGCLFGGLSSEQKQDRDHWVFQAKSQYEDKNYNHAYYYANHALEIDPEDLGAQMIQAWSLLQLGFYNDFENSETKEQMVGATHYFRTILEVSPQEFRARQGLATVAFREYFLFIERSQTFQEALRKASELEESAKDISFSESSNHDVLEDHKKLLEEWAAFEAGFKQWHKSDPQAFAQPLLEGMASEYPSLLSEEELSLLLKNSAQYLKAGHMELFKQTLNDIQSRLELSGDVWEGDALRSLEQAIKGFQGLKKTAPKFFWADRDLAFAYIARGHYLVERAFEEKGLELHEDARLDQLENAQADTVREYFQKALTHLESFIEADERSELERDEFVESYLEKHFWVGEKQNALLADVGHKLLETNREIVSERQSYRQLMALQLLVFYTYPLYGVQDLNQAEYWANRLADFDEKDPLRFFIRGIIRERKQEYDKAAEDYQRYLARSSLTLDHHRRSFARERLTDCSLKLDTEH